MIFLIIAIQLISDRSNQLYIGIGTDIDKRKTNISLHRERDTGTDTRDRSETIKIYFLLFRFWQSQKKLPAKATRNKP